MPMGGRGTRFFDDGFIIPKPLIQLQNKPFFFWAANSLYTYENVQDITFVVLKEHIEEFNIMNEIKKYFPKANIVVLEHVLNGAVLTCLEGIKNIDDDLPIVFNDCDHAFFSAKFEEFLKDESQDVDGALLTFTSNEDKFSYVKYNSNHEIVGTVEKEVVSNDAICGAYYFKNKQTFDKYTQRYLHNCSYKEFFISGVYNEMCRDSKSIVICPTDLHLSFGVPQEYNEVKDSPHFKDIYNRVADKYSLTINETC